MSRMLPRPLGTSSLLAALAVGASTIVASADVKLITLPPRERVEIQLDHPNVTLVEEERIVPLAAGVNEVVFAWTNTNVDANSLQFRCLSDPDAIKVLSSEYPPGQNAVTWQVFSPKAGPARVRVSYVIGQLNKSFVYRAVAANDESSLTLRQYIQLHNQANEAFGMSGMWPGFGPHLERPIGINETKRLLTRRFDNVPITKTYTADLSIYGYQDAAKQQLKIPMHYVIHNDADHGLGDYALTFGKARIFQDDGQGTTAFLGEDWLQFTPRDDEAALSLGLARDVVVKRIIEKREQKRIRGQLYDYDVVIRYEIENFKDSAVTLDIAESLPFIRNEVRGNTGRPVQWELGEEGTLSEHYDGDESTADRAVFHVDLPARNDDQSATKINHTFHVIIRNEW